MYQFSVKLTKHDTFLENMVLPLKQYRYGTCLEKHGTIMVNVPKMVSSLYMSKNLELSLYSSEKKP